jgi:type VI secretion system secreted protein VgrG
VFAATPSNAILSSGVTSSLSAAQDINLLAQGNALNTIAGGISLFTYGKVSNKEKSGQEAGIKLHAASGKLSCQSQSGQTTVVADKAVTVASISKSVTVGATNKHLLLTSQGAYIKLEGSNIEIHAPGNVGFKASMKELTGPVSVSDVGNGHKVNELNIKRDLEIEYIDADGNVLTDEDIAIRFSNGDDKKVTLDGNGKALIKNAPLGPLRAKQPNRK